MKIQEREDYELLNLFVEFIEETCNPALAKRYRDKFNEKMGLKLKKEYNLLTSNLNIIEKIDEDFKLKIEEIMITRKILEDAKQTREFISNQKKENN